MKVSIRDVGHKPHVDVYECNGLQNRSIGSRIDRRPDGHYAFNAQLNLNGVLTPETAVVFVYDA